MKIIATPHQVYFRVAELAQKVNKSPSGYAVGKGVSRYAIAKWKEKHEGTVNLDQALRLGVVKWK
jgi:hypothetical protein